MIQTELAPDLQILQAENAEYLARELSYLPEDWRLLVKLTVLEEWPLATLAASLGRAEQKCQEDLSLALERLRRRLRPWMDLGGH